MNIARRKEKLRINHFCGISKAGVNAVAAPLWQNVQFITCSHIGLVRLSQICIIIFFRLAIILPGFRHKLWISSKLDSLHIYVDNSPDFAKFEDSFKFRGKVSIYGRNN